jgi:hypothetical protein
MLPPLQSSLTDFNSMSGDHRRSSSFGFVLLHIICSTRVSFIVYWETQKSSRQSVDSQSAVVCARFHADAFRFKCFVAFNWFTGCGNYY